MIYTFETLPIYNFFKVSETGDMSLLSTQNEIVNDSYFEELVNEYNEIIGDKESKIDLSDKASLILIRTQYVALNNAIRILCQCDDEYHINYVISQGYKYDIENKDESLEGLLSNLQVLEKKLGRKQTEYITKHKVKESVKFDFYELIASIEMQMKMSIDIHKTSIKIFAYYIKNLQKWQTEK